jgi:hypothetical protein
MITFENVSWQNLFSSINFNHNQWYHLSGVIDSNNNTTKLYIDGRLNNEDNNETTNMLADNESMRLGTAGDVYPYINGWIDDVKVYNYARSQAQIAWDYNQGAPVGWWKFDEASSGSADGDKVNDSSGNGNHGTGNDGANDSGLSWTSGKFGNAIDFDGADDYVDLGNQSSLYFPGEFSISAWLKRTASVPTYSAYIISDYISSGDASSFALRIGGSASGNEDRFQFFWENPAATNPMVTSNTVTNQDAWYHVVGTWDGTTTRMIYVNGILENTNNTAQNRTDNGQNTTIGNAGSYHGNNVHFPGQIDDVRLYNYALTPELVKEVYNNGRVRFGN